MSNDFNLLLSQDDLINYVIPDDGFTYDPYFNQRRHALFCGFKRLTFNPQTGFYTEYKSITCKGFAVCPTCEAIRKKEIHNRIRMILDYSKLHGIATYKIYSPDKKSKRKLMQKISNKCRNKASLYDRHFAATFPYFTQKRLDHSNIGYITITTLETENSTKYDLKDFYSEYPTPDTLEIAITPIHHRISYINNDSTFDAMGEQAACQSEAEKLLYQKHIIDSVDSVVNGTYIENNGQFTDSDMLSMVRVANESKELSIEAKNKVIELCKIEPVVINPSEYVINGKNKELFDRIQLEAKSILAPLYTAITNSNANQYIKDFDERIWDLVVAYNELNTEQLLIERKSKEVVLYKPINFKYDWLDFEKYLADEQ